MKFSYSLLKKFVPKLPSAPKLAAALNTYSFEVEEARGDLLDVKLPANIYSYAASHVGLAREAAAISNLKFKNPMRRIINLPANKGLLKVEVSASDLCFRQAARYFEINKVGASPAWMKKTLISCGIRPINNVVDITNYVTLETGQPLHAFDADTIADEKISGKGTRPAKKIIVRRAANREKIKTLDGKGFVLDPAMLVIADREKSLDVAGIKGGQHTGIERKTRRIILVASNFDAVNIYKTSRKLGLVTDASIRFSHNLSPVLVDWGMDRATELLKDMGAKLIDSVDHYPKPAGDAIIDFDPEKYEKLIGAPILVSDAKRYFTMLGFTVDLKIKKGEGVLRVRVPAWRNDIENFEDLAEEVARLEGYNDLEKQPPLVAIRAAKEDQIFILKDHARHFFVKLGVDEVCNYSFVGPEDITGNLPLFGGGDRPVELENPISEDKRFMRPALLPLLRNNAVQNARFYDSVRIFETGKVFRERGNKIEEKLSLGIALAARRNHKLILELKGMVNEFLLAMGIGGFYFLEEENILYVRHSSGTIAELRQETLQKDLIAASAEVNLDLVETLREEHARFRPLAKYPGTSRDLSMALPAGIKIGELVKAVFEGAQHVEDVDLIDEYKDEKLGGKLGITLRVAFQAGNRTLTDEEVNHEMAKISSQLAGAFGVTLR